ncbi:MAG: hypothetical protein EHM45_12125 [Desulfobacteraceae bacterium]|nr:MAG: hypothetical protein EHM45_12125 [Desulfobacteraceae bacterium]
MNTHNQTTFSTPMDSVLEFADGIFREHLLEISFLYEQRLALLDDPKFPWLDIADFEHRLEPHLSALSEGGEQALELCKQQAIESDFGELYGALCVFCRQNHFDLVMSTIKAVDLADEQKQQAIINALKHESLPEWENEFKKLCASKNPFEVSLAAEVLGFQRRESGPELLKALEKSDLIAASKLIWALGRIEYQAAKPLLLTFLFQKDETLASQAALALLRMGDSQVIDECLRQALTHTWPLVLLAVSAGPEALDVLLQHATIEEHCPDSLLALGLFGATEAIPILLSQFSTDMAEQAALSLNLITGADLYEDIFVPEPIDEDALFDHEKEKLSRGEPLYAPGEQPGETVTRLSQNPELWQNWWEQNQNHFAYGIRYRHGRLFSLSCLLQTLESEKSPRFLRQWAYEEWVIRYGANFPFEIDMFTNNQKQTMAAYAQWLENNQTKFQAGK